MWKKIGMWLLRNVVKGLVEEMGLDPRVAGKLPPGVPKSVPPQAPGDVNNG